MTTLFLNGIVRQKIMVKQGNKGNSTLVPSLITMNIKHGSQSYTIADQILFGS